MKNKCFIALKDGMINLIYETSKCVVIYEFLHWKQLITSPLHITKTST